MSALATHVASCGRNEDRLLVDEVGDRTLLVVADGAGGMANAAPVAQLICERVHARFLQYEVSDWVTQLRDLDAAVAASPLGGCATVAVVEIVSAILVGASVGDSEAWMLTPSGVHDLTTHQKRKPLLGSGKALPVAFGPFPVNGRLLLATDGLFKYAPADRVVDVAGSSHVQDAVRALVDSVRLRSGALQDDVAIALYDFVG